MSARLTIDGQSPAEASVGTVVRPFEPNEGGAFDEFTAHEGFLAGINPNSERAVSAQEKIMFEAAFTVRPHPMGCPI